MDTNFLYRKKSIFEIFDIFEMYEKSSGAKKMFRSLKCVLVQVEFAKKTKNF